MISLLNVGICYECYTKGRRTIMAEQPDISEEAKEAFIPEEVIDGED